MLFLNSGEALLNRLLVLCRLRLSTEMFDSVNEESACPTCRIENCFTEAGIYLFDNELRDSARCIEFAGVSGGLKIFQKLLINVAKHVAIVGGVEVNAVDLVDDLPHQRVVLHVV